MSISRKTERTGGRACHRAPRILTVLQPRAQCRDERRVGGARRAGVERRRRVILDTELDLLGDLLAAELRRDKEREIDPRCDAATGDSIAVPYDALGNRDRPQ